jgi:hypothetical protein
VSSSARIGAERAVAGSIADADAHATIIQKLRDLENQLYGDNQNADIQIELSRIMHRQIAWQQFRPQTKHTYRYYRIFSDPAVDAICRKVVGLSVDALYYQGVLAYAHFAKVPALELTAKTAMGDLTPR